MPEGNRRKSSRRALNYPAKIVANDGSWDRDCRVVDVSNEGARLTTASPSELPADFLLAFTARTGRRCRLAWTEEKEIGVQFVR
jgi:hypothetical protein